MCAKSGRILLRVAFAFAMLCAVMLVCCLDGVDYQPYFLAPYYKDTVARLRASMRTNTVSRGQLAAGFGRARLTPGTNTGALPLAGYGNRNGRPSSGVHDELYVKAIALRVGNLTGVMVGADALIVPREVADLAVERLRQVAGLRREQIYLGATHTHSSLGGWGEGMVAEAFSGGFQPKARTWFADCIVTAVTNAIADIQPAAFGHGSFPAPEFVRNRLVHDLGQVDPEFGYAFIKQQDGAIAVLGSYSAHATVLSGSMMEFSGDYPGYWQRAVERATGGMAMFLAGGVGSHSPVAGEPGLNGAERLGEALSRRLLEELPGARLTNSISFGLVGAVISMPSLHVRVSDGVRLRPWLAAQLLHRPESSFIQAFRIHDFIWVSTPCDFSGELALVLKESLRARGFQAAITSFNGDYIGYVVPSRYYHMSGYEPRLMSFYGPTVPDYFDELIRTMSLHLATN